MMPPSHGPNRLIDPIPTACLPPSPQIEYFVPVEVLAYYDLPLLCTHSLSDRPTMLAYMLPKEGESLRYLSAEVTPAVVLTVTSGIIPIREAFTSSKFLCVITVVNDWSIAGIEEVAVAQASDRKVLPRGWMASLIDWQPIAPSFYCW